MGSASVTQQPTCTNNQATIQATANSGGCFSQWSDGATANPRTVTVTEDITLTAMFTATPTITVQSNNSTMGSASVTQQPTCTNPQAIIQAYPNSGYYFLKWSDNNTRNPRTLSVTQNMNLTAIFEFEGIGEVTDTIEIPNGQTIVVVPDTTTVQVAWQANKDATGYTITIYDASHTKIICSLELDAIGRLIGIVFKNKEQKGDDNSVFAIKITKLSENTTYFYKMETLGENSTVLDTKEGTFTTLGAGTGIDDCRFTISDLHVYPNPTTGQLTITISDVRYAISDLRLFDMMGRQIPIGKSEIGKSEIQINLFHLPAGIYFLRVDGKTVKVIKN